MKDKLIPEIINRKSSYNFSNKKILNDEIQILIEATKWLLHQGICSHGELFSFPMKVRVTIHCLIP